MGQFALTFNIGAGAFYFIRQIFNPAWPSIITMSEEKIDLRAEIDSAIKKGQFATKEEAIAGLQKQLIDYQKGAMKDKLKDVSPIRSVEALREQIWGELLEKAGGNEDKAAELYLEELKKLKL